MLFFEDKVALALAGNLVSVVAMILTCAISVYVAPRLPQTLHGFIQSSSGKERDVAKWVGLVFAPLIGFFFFGVGALLADPELTTLIKMQTGFWIRLGASIVYPVVHFATLASHLKEDRKGERS
jgi:hypothetical protein